MATEQESMATQAAEAGCAHFERTLSLLDGAVTEREAAEAHAHACPVCGPLVAGWERTGAALVAEYEDLAERAKPDLAGMADRVLASIDARPAPKKAAGGLRWLSLLQPWVALAGAAAALVLVLGPLLMSGPSPSAGPSVAPVADGKEPDAVPQDAVAAGGVDGGDCHIHKVTFEGADGMVFRTERGGMTVIWINEHPGA